MGPMQRRVSVAAIVVAFIAGGCTPGVRSGVRELPAVLKEAEQISGGVLGELPGKVDLPTLRPTSIPTRGPAPVTPIVDAPLTFAQRQLAKYMQELEDGTFAKKQVKKAACSAMRDVIADPEDKRAWKRRIILHTSSLVSPADLRSLDPIVDNVAARLAAVGSDQGLVYVIACRF